MYFASGCEVTTSEQMQQITLTGKRILNSMYGPFASKGLFIPSDIHFSHHRIFPMLPSDKEVFLSIVRTIKKLNWQL